MRILLPLVQSSKILLKSSIRLSSSSNTVTSIKMSLSKTCCTLPPVESSYIPKGTESVLGDLGLYETGDLSSDRLLICAYDIFGIHPVTKQFCDKLGTSGFRVVMPDFFRGKPFPSENFPPAE